MVKIDLNLQLYNALEFLSEHSQDILMSLFQQNALQPHQTLKQALMIMDEASSYEADLFDNLMEELVNKKTKQESAMNTNNALGEKISMNYEDGTEVFIKNIDSDLPTRVLGDIMAENNRFISTVGQKGLLAELGITCEELLSHATSREIEIIDYAMSRLFMPFEKDVSLLLIKLNTLIEGDKSASLSGGGGADISTIDFEINAAPTRFDSMNQQQLRQENTKGFATEALNCVNDLLERIQNPTGFKFKKFLNDLKTDEFSELIDLLMNGYTMLYEKS